jgi:hypothetical protein
MATWVQCSGVYGSATKSALKPLIAEATLAKEFGASAEDIARTLPRPPHLERGPEGGSPRCRWPGHSHLRRGLADDKSLNGRPDQAILAK